VKEDGGGRSTVKMRLNSGPRQSPLASMDSEQSGKEWRRGSLPERICERWKSCQLSFTIRAKCDIYTGQSFSVAGRRPRT